MKDAEAKLRRRGVIALAADTIASGQICLCAVNAIASNKMAIKGAAAGRLEAALQPVREVIGLEGPQRENLEECKRILMRRATSLAVRSISRSPSNFSLIAKFVHNITAHLFRNLLFIVFCIFLCSWTLAELI